MNPSKFLRNSKNFSGSTTGGKKISSKMTAARRKALVTLVSMASQLDESQLDVATKILQNSREELAAYVTQNKEVPTPNINKLIVQAAIIRLGEISSVSRVLDISNSESLEEIEEAETEAIEQNQSAFILSPQAQAALLIVMESIMDRVKSSTGIKSVKEYISLLKQSATSNGAENYTGDEWYNFYTTAIGENSQSPAANSTNSLKDWITVIGTQATNIYNAVFGKGSGTGTGTPTDTNYNPLNDLLNKIKNIGSDTGSDSINKSLDKYKWYIVGGFALLLLVIIISVYATKRK